MRRDKGSELSRGWMNRFGNISMLAVLLLSAAIAMAWLPGRAYAESRVWADFNGDGYDDLAIGVRFEDIGTIGDAGGVNVIYGSASRLSSTGNQFWHQNSSGILDTAEIGDRFGFSLTAGDFNGDGFDDLAIGVSSEDIGNIVDAGGVNIIYGSANRLSSTGNQFWNQNGGTPIFPILDSAEEDDHFGSSLTSGDFNGDGFDDLAIGVSSEDIGNIVDAGGVNIIYGSANRLTSTGNQFWSQNSTNILDNAEEDDFFGSSLTSGDFNGDGFDDLAIGVAIAIGVASFFGGEDNGTIEDAGGVNVIYGSANRLTSTGNQFWSQNSTNILDNAEVSDHFGTSLAAGDFNGDGYDDLAIGVPGENIGSIIDAGAVNVIYGSANRLTSTGNQLWHQNSGGILDTAEMGDFEMGDEFGESLTSGDFNGDGFDDLAIGVDLEDIVGIVDAGAVNVIYGAANRLSSIGNQFWHQSSTNILDSAAEGDRFGFSLTSGDFNGDGFDDLAIGVLLEDIGSIENAGGVNVIYGSASRLSSTGNQFWNQNSGGILDSAELFDNFGSSLAN